MRTNTRVNDIYRDKGEHEGVRRDWIWDMRSNTKVNTTDRDKDKAEHEDKCQRYKWVEHEGERHG